MSASPRTSVAAPPPPPRADGRTLADAREAFVAGVRRDTPGSDLARYVAVLDALLAWSAARPGRLAFAGEGAPAGAVRFARSGPGARGAVWTARPARGDAPVLELTTPADPARAAAARETLNAHSRAVLGAGARLRIGFGALKNAAALAAVLALLDGLLADGAGA